MRLDFLDLSHIFLFVHLTAAQIVAGCENSFNCTECLRFNDCKFLRCAKTSHCANRTDVNISCPIEDYIDIATIIDIQHCPTTDYNDHRSNETIKLITTDSPIGNKPIDTTTATTATTTTVETTSAMSRLRNRTSNQTTTTTPTPISNQPTSVSSPMGQSTSITRRFDGPSFIGGIVLTIGLLSIAYVVFKFYWARTERNYHTLPGI